MALAPARCRKDLKEDGLLVRCGNFRGLQGEFIRVAIGSRAEKRAF